MQISVESAVAYLESRGFVNKKQNLRLLKKANYNAELVADFLAAKQALINATNSDDQKNTKPFVLRHKLAKETQPELFAKFIEAKKALHSSKPSDIPVESEEPLKDKRCPLTKEERIARKEQRLRRLKSQLESKEEEERTPVVSPSPISHVPVALDDNTVKEEEEEDVEPKKRNFLTKEERIARKIQRIQLKAANIKNKDLVLKTEEEDNSVAPVTSEEQVPRRGRLSKEERLARKETRLRMKLSKLSQKQNPQQEEEEEESKDIASDTTLPQRKCVGKLTKEEKLARKEERLKLKEARLNLKQQRLAKREGIHIAPRVTTVFIDGSSFSKSQVEIMEMAKKLVEKNSQVEKFVILYEGVEVISQNLEKIVIASATPLFESVQDAVKILALKIADKKTMSVISGNKSWIQEIRKEGVSAIVPVF